MVEPPAAHPADSTEALIEQISGELTHYDLSRDPGYIRVPTERVRSILRAALQASAPSPDRGDVGLYYVRPGWSAAPSAPDLAVELATMSLATYAEWAWWIGEVEAAGYRLVRAAAEPCPYCAENPNHRKRHRAAAEEPRPGYCECGKRLGHKP